jgi:hypothetical protein
MVGRLFISVVGVAIVFVGSACRPTETPIVEPTASIPEPAAELATQPLTEDVGEETIESSTDDGGFVVTVGSRCNDTWRAAVMRDGGVRREGPEPGRFDVPNASTRELKLQPGDSLLLTSPHGGIMALQFDNLSKGYNARVEVTEACSGVKRTVVPR